MFGVVQLKHDLIGQMKRNWMKEQLVSTLLVMLRAPGALIFIIPLLDHFLRREMQDSLRMLSLEGKIMQGVLFLKKNKRTIKIKFSYLMLFFYPNIALDNAQVILANIVQDVIMVRDNNEVLPAYDIIDQVILPNIVQDDASAEDNDEVLPQEPIVQTQQPQEVPLRRSIRERRSVIPDDYIVFLPEHKVNVTLAKIIQSIFNKFYKVLILTSGLMP